MIACLRRAALVVSIIALTVGATVAPATATAGKPTSLRVNGTQTQVSEKLYKSHGGLLGNFWILTFVPLYESESLVIATGTERFVGCVDVNLNRACQASEPSGELQFDYVQWATFDPSTGALIEGNCVHPITGGRDSFQGARGLVTMHDVLVEGDVRTTYEGTVVLNAVPADASAAQLPRAHAFAARPQAAHTFAADVSSASRGHC